MNTKAFFLQSDIVSILSKESLFKSLSHLLVRLLLRVTNHLYSYSNMRDTQKIISCKPLQYGNQ